jgi:tRNA(Ile)-lysidine synthetase-like protein
MQATNGGPGRRVKRFFADAKIAGPLREGWPVVVASGGVVWIPGVRVVPAMQYPRGEGFVFYCCERFTD